MAAVEFFQHPEDYRLGEMDGETFEPGWYYWYCQPGCLPDSEAFGPFQSCDDAMEHYRKANGIAEIEDQRVPCAGCGEMVPVDETITHKGKVYCGGDCGAPYFDALLAEVQMEIE